MRPIRHHLRVRRNPVRVLRVVCHILQTRNTHGYNSVLERIFRSIVLAGPRS
ncbi:MAG TPA: hypothetical protein PK749_09095 [Deltaproteobacteria bacterium]|nr:hypothetical protein [Deltaproteobacteria bacterium]